MPVVDEGDRVEGTVGFSHIIENPQKAKRK